MSHNKKITSLTTSTQTITDPQTIHDTIQAHFQNTFTPSNVSDLQQFLTQAASSALPPAAIEMLASPITETEVEEAIDKTS